MKKICLFLILLFGSALTVNATSISKIDMDIYVDNNGNGYVTETWVANVTEGTEGYHPYYNLGNATISDLSVSMDGRNFETISNWNINSSLYDKAYKTGFYNASSDELDICFGISSYGTHTYVIKYKINGFVVGLADADMIYFNLFPYDFSVSPGEVNIKIYSDFKYSDSLDVWGYGKYGAPCYVYDGVIEMTSDGESVSSDEYMTILVKFDKDTFNTNNVLDEEFSYYYNMAEEGATTYTGDSYKSSFWDFIVGFFSVFINVFIWVGIVLFAIFSGNRNKKVRFGNAGNKVRKGVPNFREIPCNKDIYRAYWVSSNYNLAKKKEDFLGAVILKWLQNGNVTIEKVTKKKMLKETTESNIVFAKEPQGIELERKLYDYMEEASGDGKLESNEFKKWCSDHYSKILRWFDDVLEFENKMLVNEGKAEIITLGKVFKYNVYQIDDSMMEEAEKMAGLKNFLKEFSMIKEREPIEVNLWNEYLMYAQIFGIADEVASQFKKLYPEVIQDMESMGYTYNDVVFVHTISSNGIKSASAAKSRAESYSSGGGGFSSGGGGGGSFGGGGGGGGFR